MSQRHPISVLKTEFADDDATVLVGFDPDHTQPDVTSVAAVQAAVDAMRPGLEVIEVAAHDWMKDPLSRTTWMTHRPGQLNRDLAGLQAACGRGALRLERQRELVGAGEGVFGGVAEGSGDGADGVVGIAQGSPCISLLEWCLS